MRQQRKEEIMAILYANTRDASEKVTASQAILTEADDGEKRRKQLCSYSHRQVRFIVIRQQAVPRRLT